MNFHVIFQRDWALQVLQKLQGNLSYSVWAHYKSSKSKKIRNAKKKQKICLAFSRKSTHLYDFTSTCKTIATKESNTFASGWLQKVTLKYCVFVWAHERQSLRMDTKAELGSLATLWSSQNSTALRESLVSAFQRLCEVTISAPHPCPWCVTAWLLCTPPRCHFSPRCWFPSPFGCPGRCERSGWGLLLAISSLSFELRKWVSVGKLWRRCSWTHSHLFNVIRVWPGKCHRHTEHRLNQHQMLMKMTISQVDCCALCTPWHVTEFLIWLYALVQPQVAMESRGGRQLVHQGIKWYRLIREFNTQKKASEVLSCIDSALHTTVKAKISLPL